MFSTLGVFSTLGRYHEYIGDIMSTSGVFSTLGYVMMPMGDIMMHVGSKLVKTF